MIFVDDYMVFATQQDQIRISISFRDRHAPVTARAVVLFGHDVGFFADYDWMGRA